MKIVLSNSDVARVPADLLVMKHAEGFHGADEYIAQLVGFDDLLSAGEIRVVPGNGISSTEVLFAGVGSLYDFRYKAIQDFGSAVIGFARNHRYPVKHLCLTAHGPGYGLDPEESFLSLIAGVADALNPNVDTIAQITIAEISKHRCKTYISAIQRFLEKSGDDFGLGTFRKVPYGVEFFQDHASPHVDHHIDFGARAESKERLFVAMPFSDLFKDEYDIGFFEAARENQYLCERLDLEAFTGDIVSEIKRRISECHGVIALLNNQNPNVFLEIGFAWACNKPTILVAKDGEKLPFDVQGHRCINYSSIYELRERLTREISHLKRNGRLRS